MGYGYQVPLGGLLVAYQVVKHCMRPFQARLIAYLVLGLCSTLAALVLCDTENTAGDDLQLYEPSLKRIKRGCGHSALWSTSVFFRS